MEEKKSLGKELQEKLTFTQPHIADEQPDAVAEAERFCVDYKAFLDAACQTVDDFIGIRGSICGLFLFVQTHNPDISWSRTGRIQLNQEVAVTVTYETNIGLFSGFGSFPITLRADATGKSEVYWK